MKGTNILLLIGFAALAVLILSSRPTTESSTGRGKVVSCEANQPCMTPGQFCFTRPEDPQSDVMECTVTNGVGSYHLASPERASTFRAALTKKNGGAR